MTTRPTTGGLHGAAVRAAYAAAPPAELLTRYLDGRDEAAFRELVERFSGVVGRACRAVLGRDDLARDAFQETFLKLVRHGRTLRNRDGLAAWLDRVARAVASNLRRREARQRRHAMATPADPRPDPPPDADELAKLRAALALLPLHYRLPLELVYLEGLTHAEAAQRLGRPKGTIDSAVSRGLTRLRALLGSAPAVAALPTAARAVPAEWVEATVRAAAAVVPRSAGLAGDAAAWLATRPTSALLWAGAAGLVAGGVVAAALTAPPAVPAPVVAARPAPEPDPESLPARNKRVLEAEVLPKVVAALRPGVLGGGEVVVSRVDVHDFRAMCEVELRHAGAPAGVPTTRLRMYLNTATGRTAVQVDAWGRGEFRHLDPGRPVVLLQVPEVKLDVALRSEPLEQAVAILRGFPADGRSAGETARYVAQLRAALAPYQGVWRYHGDASRRSPFATELPAGPGAGVHVPDRGVVEAALLAVEPDGRVRHLFDEPPYHPYTLSPDGRRLTVPGTDLWWERE